MEPSFTVLLVDKDHDYLDWATRHLEANDIRILRCDSSTNALKVIEKTKIDLMVVDVAIPPTNGVQLMIDGRTRNNDLVTILTGSFPYTSQIIEATQKGAYEIIRKESLTFELRKVVEAALQTIEGRRNASGLETELPKTDGRVKIIGNSRALQDVFKIVGRVAKSDAPVLVTGESGTGKELISHAIHTYSPRAKKEIVAINCGAIPANLLESELFGHEKGSFTGAMARRAGRFEQCDGGTLFLDEIGEMPAHVQVSLLRVLQTGTFSRVGGNETIKTDVRIVAATNKDLASEVSNGNFREDLYYRLNVVEINLPPLRDRKEDIPELANFFLEKITRKNGMARLQISPEAVDKLSTHNWPGNVRELENTIARACALSHSNVLLAEDIPLGRTPGIGERSLDEALQTVFKYASVNSETPLLFIQQAVARHALDSTNDDMKEAARLLGVKLSQMRDILHPEP